MRGRAVAVAVAVAVALLGAGCTHRRRDATLLDLGPPASETSARSSAVTDAVAQALGPLGTETAAAVIDIDLGVVAEVRGDLVLPQESVFKLWVALAVVDAIDRGALGWDDPITITPADLHFPYQPLADDHPDGGTFTVRELTRLAITVSDNPSADALVAKLGGPAEVQATLLRKGIDGVTLTMTETALHDDYAALRALVDAAPPAEAPGLVRARLAARNGATAHGIAAALARLVQGELASAEGTRALIGMLRETSTGANRLRAGLPDGWELAHKTGTGFELGGVSLGTNDVGILACPDGRSLAVAVLIGGVEAPQDARERAIAAIAAAATAPPSR